MSQTIGKLPRGRFLSGRFQKKVLRNVCHVPADLSCPECHHRYDIVVSRRQVVGSLWSRKLIRYFRCRVCDHRFSRWNPEPVRKMAWATLGMATFTAVLLLPGWLL